MILNIGAEFSREFTFQEGDITSNLEEELNNLFKNSDYGDRIKKIYIGVICVSKDFSPFYNPRPLKIYKTEPSLEYEFKLDFETFKSANESNRKLILINEFFKKTKEYLMAKTINGFEKEQFIDDLESYFKEQGYLKNR